MKQENKKEQKTLDVLYASSMRDLVQQANSRGIQKEDIVQVVPTEREFFLIYYK
jgi:hypothetical protein